MSYTGISTLIIIVTSLVAFYLLYRAKELNLGILMSISLGSITLGFTFLPVFKAVMVLLKESIFINKSFAFIISVLAVLIIFLIFILVISLIISLAMPNKLASIDCCVVIDNAIAKIKYGYTENMLKKPVDTEQKIDTMGIEKEEVNSDITLHNVAYDDACACEETINEVTYTVQEESRDSDITDQVNDDYDNMIQSENIETINSDMSEEIEIYYSDNNNVGDQISETVVPQAETVKINAVEADVQKQEILEVNISESETQIPAPEAKLEKFSTEEVNDAQTLVLKALQKKGDDKKEEAIEYYMRALQKQPDVEMILWIVLDVCALYKQLGLNELAISILETLASQYGTAIKPEVKKEIMNCLI